VSKNPAPTISSFTLTVAAYVPLRPATSPTATAQAQAQAKAKQQQQQQQQQGGGGGRRGGNANQLEQEKPGATRIISILKEGTPVKAGDLVCELDSAAFRDEVMAQEIKYAQAKAYVDQARSLLEVNQISLREYRDGVYPQDAQLISQYLTTCELERERTLGNLKWSEGLYAKGMRAKGQLQADRLSVQQAEIAYQGALNMKERLEKYTAPRLIKSLEAKIEANRADLLAQEATFQRESDRLRRLKAMVENCMMRAPMDGIVVYANQTNPWGRVEAQIDEGQTVREGQAVFYLPDPSRMRVKAKVNEAKVSEIETGQETEVRIDAFPDRPLRGKVAEIMPIPAPANGPMSDTHIYYVYVNLDSTFEGLRPGMTTEVSFFVKSQADVTRIPVDAIRWVRDEPYAALMGADGPRWRRLELGAINASYAEVRSGLEPGDRVVAEPDLLAPPSPTATTRTAQGPANRARG
jgi:RND family efflux transporter MFP subunit